MIIESKNIQLKHKKRVDLRHKAFFTDKIRVDENKPQLYGAQVRKKENGEIELIEIEDRENVNKRRKELGMESLEKYLEQFGVK